MVEAVAASPSPFAAYNRVTDSNVPTLIGNYQEERALLDATGISRVAPWTTLATEPPTSTFATRQDNVTAMPTRPRVLDHEERLHPADWESMYTRSYAGARSGPQLMEYKGTSKLGPRAAKELAALRAQARELQRDTAPTIISSHMPQELQTTHRTDFIPKDVTANTIGARCMKDQHGRPPVRDPTFLAETQLVPRPNADRLFGTAPMEAGATQTLLQPDPEGPPISFYSEAVATSKYGGSGFTGTKSLGGLHTSQPFNKYTNFTKPMDCFSKCVDDE